jgi:hypothetical protein
MPIVGVPAYRALFAGAVSTMPAGHRELLGLPPYPLALTRPAVGVILAGLQFVLGPASPSQRAARARIDEMAAGSDRVS